MARCRDTAIFRLWERNKVVYAMDDLMLHYLSQSSADKVPSSILGRLPHANPFVLLPKPDFSDEDTQYYRSHIGVPTGAFIFGKYQDGSFLCSTSDDCMEDLGVMFFGFIETPDHGPIAQTLRCTIPLSKKETTVEDVVNRTVEGFHFSPDLREGDRSRLEAWLRRYVAQVFNSLLYVCTDQPDVQVSQPGVTPVGKAKKIKKPRRPRPDDVNTVVKLGFRMGPALHAAEKAYKERQESEASESGRRLRPHQKRGHYRKYYTGPGGSETALKWIKPFWVNADLDVTPDNVVVHPVRGK
jgi:hypothetical protein